GKSISQQLMEPLPFSCRTLGENRSLPIGWRAPGHDGGTAGQAQAEGQDAPRLAVTPVEVNPMLQMTAEEIMQHIGSVRREGRFTSFEKVREILLKLISDPRNRHGVFNTAVDPEALELPTYRSIVQHPMDLGTVKWRMEAGQYLELEDFVSDVRLVFENAMLFNPESHYIHVDAQLLLARFNEAVRGEQNRQNKRQRVQHACLVCRGSTCIVCNQQCLPMAQPHLQCSGGCNADIRKGAVYFATRDGTRVWCAKCRSRITKDRHARQEEATAGDGPLDAMIKKKSEVGVEPWVKCGECDRWLHQVCGLYNPVIGAYSAAQPPCQEPSNGLSIGVSATTTYVCPLCRWRRKRATPPPESPMRRILNADPDEHARNNSCLNIPSCELSEFIQSFLRRGLVDLGEHEAAQTLHVRALSFPGERMAVPDGVVRAFDENSQLLAQMEPDTDTSAQRLPSHIGYLSRGLYLFQKHEGMEVCLFTLYAQEFGDDCEMEANRRAVYIAYLDSVRYLKPASARTTAYHLILLAYFDYVRRHGFSRVHIWSCPPQKRISYVFWCRPPFQKTPSAEHLRLWYNRLLTKAKDRGIVKSWSTMYDCYFSGERVSNGAASGSPASYVSVKEEGGGVSTRGSTVRTVGPNELRWPAKQLPPIFDGDIIPSELERILGRIVARNEKQSRAAENKKSVYGKSSKHARVGGKRAVGELMVRIKEEDAPAETQALQMPQVEVKLREMFSKCQFAIQRLKNDLLVVELAAAEEGETEETKGEQEQEQAVSAASRPARRRRACRPEALVPAWSSQVPRFFGSRFMFHQLCSSAGYQFDSLRRAKHSTMMMLHHYFNERVAQLNVFCRECSLLVTRAAFWSCPTCERYALCDSCHLRLGAAHPHALVFGPAPAAEEPPQQQAEGLLGLSDLIPQLNTMELTLEAVAKDAFRRDFFLRAFPEREAQALELRFSFLHRVRQFKRLVGRRDLLPGAPNEAAPLLLPAAAEPVVARVLRAVASGRCPLDLFCGLEALVLAHMTRDAFPQFLRSSEYKGLCDALRARRELPLAEVLVDARRTQFLRRFLRDAFPGDEGNLRFWVDVQTRFLPLIQTSLFSVALFEEVQRHVRHVFNQFLVASSGDGESSAASRVPEAVRRATLQQIMRLQSEPFSPPRYASLFRAAQDCVWQWLQTEVYPKFLNSSLYVLLVVETEDLETDRQLRRLSEHVQAAVKTSVATQQERGSGGEGEKGATTQKASDAQLKANAVLVPIQQPLSQQQKWAQAAAPQRHVYCRVLAIPELTAHGIHSVSLASVTSVDWDNQINHELFATGDLAESARGTHPADDEEAHDSHAGGASHQLFGLSLKFWRERPLAEEPSGSNASDPAASSTGGKATNDGGSAVAWLELPRYYPRFVSLLTTTPMYTTGRRLLLRLASECVQDDLTEATLVRLLSALFASASPVVRPALSVKYGGFFLKPALDSIELPLHRVFKEIGTQHVYLPLCPMATSLALCDAGLFASACSSPFLLGCEGALVNQKQKELGVDQRYRIPTAGEAVAAASTGYPLELLQTEAIIIDIDSDDVYIPERVELPEFPQSMLSTALHSPRITQADSHLFNPAKNPSFMGTMLEPHESNEKLVRINEPPVELPSTCKTESPVSPSLDDGVRLALLWFLEALFGDVIYHFCSFQRTFVVEKRQVSTADEFLLFEVDSFLDAHTELGCRDFFRQCFHTEVHGWLLCSLGGPVYTSAA
ncbi:hypothetical protein BBJ28_00021925, partial [Nothophytophthora sp. Chile5]